MVTEFGMSDLLGAVNYDGNKRPMFIDTPFGSERGNYSEETALKIDAEVKRILGEAHETSRRVLRERRATLDALSERLLEKEVIEAEELKAIMGSVPPQDPDGTVPLPRPDVGITAM
jgi:cell division protease FtsH